MSVWECLYVSEWAGWCKCGLYIAEVGPSEPGPQALFPFQNHFGQVVSSQDLELDQRCYQEGPGSYQEREQIREKVDDCKRHIPTNRHCSSNSLELCVTGGREGLWVLFCVCVCFLLIRAYSGTNFDLWIFVLTTVGSVCKVPFSKSFWEWSCYFFKGNLSISCTSRRIKMFLNFKYFMQNVSWNKGKKNLWKS
jgi:hypothetical protein